MVAHLLRLKLTLLRNGFKRSPWQLVGLIIGGLYALGMLALGVTLLWFVATNDPAWHNNIAVLVPAVVILGWALIPPLLTGVDLTLEPQRFVHYGIPNRQLGNGLILAGFLSIPAALTVLGLVLSAVLWRAQALTLVLGIFSGLGSAITAILLCQLITIAATKLRGKRRFREVTFALLFIALVMLGPIFSGISGIAAGAQAWLEPLVAVLSFTPLGAFGAVPGAVAAGSWAMAALYLVLALAYIAALYLGLMRLTVTSLIAPPAAQSKSKAHGLGMFKLFPGTPAGSIAARCLIYWFKDPRYALGVIMVPLLPVIFYFAGMQSGTFTMMFVLGPMIGILLGFSISADISYDNTAFSLHVLTGVSGYHDRLGRVMACFCVAILPVLLAAVLPGLLMDQSWRVAGDLGLSLSALLVALAVASVASARFTYAAPLPGDNPMKTPPGNGMRTALTQLGTFGSMALLLIPVLVPYIIGLVTGSSTLGYIALAVGVVYGAVLLIVGLRLGGRVLDSRRPELMQSVMLNR